MGLPIWPPQPQEDGDTISSCCALSVIPCSIPLISTLLFLTKCIFFSPTGGAGVGKTAMIQQFLYSHFLTSHKPTVEDLYTVDYDGPDTSTVTVEILDTSGTYEFPAMRKLAIEKADAFILVYSASDFGTFDQVSALRNEIATSRRDFDDVTTVIVCNKYDNMASSTDYEGSGDAQEMSVEERTVIYRWKHRLYKCSAKTDVNIVNMFINILNHANINCTPNIVEEKRRKSLPIYLYKDHKSNIHKTQHRHSCAIS